MNTCRTRRAVESNFLIEVMVFFGGFTSDSKIFMISLVFSNHVVVVVLPSAVVHVSDRG